MRACRSLLALCCLTSVALAAKRPARKAAARPTHASAKGVAKEQAPAKEAEAKPAKPKPPPEILLTFDDGPAIGKTPKVLDILDEHKIKAVFFVNGWHFQGNTPGAEAARALLREEIRRGHAVGNHTVHHYFLCGKVYSKRAQQEIEENAALIESAIGSKPELFRTPYGAHCPQLSAVFASLGIKPIGWDIDPQDWRLRNAPKIEAAVERELKVLHGRAIVLFHDVQAATVEALPHILAWLDKENAARVQRGEPPIAIIDYTYLLPERKLVPPFFDGIGRILIQMLPRPPRPPVPLWPSLAWVGGQV